MRNNSYFSLVSAVSAFIQAGARGDVIAAAGAASKGMGKIFAFEAACLLPWPGSFNIWVRHLFMNLQEINR